MSIGLLIITHNHTGKDLLLSATNMFGHCPLQARTIEVFDDSNPDQLKAEAAQMVKQLDSGEGVLILADMYGSTPGNIATSLYQENKIHVLAGVNLPMLARIFNYAQLGLHEITDAAITGGQKSIIECKPTKHH